MLSSYNHTKYLVLSSFLFLIPGIYALLLKFYFFFILLFLTSLISAIYWIKPIYSWRRSLDLTFSKISFIIFFYNGILNVHNFYYILIGYSGIILILYFYYLSNTLFNKNNNWYIYHMLFHFIIMIEQLIIIKSIKNNKFV